MRTHRLSIRLTVVIAMLTLLTATVLAAHEGLHEQIVEVTRQLMREPKNARLYLRRGELYRLHGEWKSALADYRRAESLDPHLEEVKLGRGRLYYEAKKPTLAKLWLDRFLAVNPDHADALVTRGRILVILRHRLAAVKDYSRAIDLLDRPKPEYYIERASTLVAEGRGNEALKGIEEGIKKLGPIVTLQLFAIDLELSGGRYDAALSRLDQISSQSPRKENWLARRGEILRQAGRGPEARGAFQAALAAIESLPPHHRVSKATRELEARIRAAMGSS